MAQVIELPNGAFYDNNLPWEDQSASAQTWYTDNFATWLETYMFKGAAYTMNNVTLPAPYTGNWQNRRSYADQSNLPDAQDWYNDAFPVFSRVVVFSNVNETVELLRGAGVYNRLLPLSGQTVDVQDYVNQSLDEARRLTIYQVETPQDILIPNGEIWDNSKPYAAQTAGAQTEADLLWTGGANSGVKNVIDGPSYINRKDNATWRLIIPANGSNDYFIENI